jgi:hypothetical protein
MGTPQQVPVGAFYGLPGYTQPLEQYENLQNLTTALSLAAQTSFNPPGSFQKTDIVKWWELETTINVTTTFVGSTFQPEGPYNIYQGFKLQLQGQYTPVECESGFDVAFFQQYRPMRGRGQLSAQNMMGAATPNAFANAAEQQTNLSTVSGAGANTNLPAAGSSSTFLLEIPGGLFIDGYWDLAIDGTLLPNAAGAIAPISAFVSPQYMGGGERVVVPKFQFAALTAPDADHGPWTGTSAGAANVLINARRIGIYASANPAELPPVFNWQYRRASKRFPLGAVTKVDIPVTEYGQLLSVWVKLFDPTAGVGTYPVVTTTVTKAQLLYGSNLPRFDDDMLTMQRRFQDQHGFLPPQGTVIWDMLANTSGDALSNDMRVLNTLTNANTHVHLEFNAAPGASTYAVIGTELLVPVATQ